MNKISIDSFIKILADGLKLYLDGEGIKIINDDLQILEKKLSSEFLLPFSEQSQTPTQLINNFLKVKYNFEKVVTPQNLGPEAHEQIMLWGLIKARHYDD